MNERNRHALLVVIRRRVQIQDLDNLGRTDPLRKSTERQGARDRERATHLRDGELVAHIADGVDVIVRLPRLQDLGRLDDGGERVGDAGLVQAHVARPLLQVAQVVPDLHSFGPVTHVLPQQEVVQSARADEVEDLERAISLLNESGYVFLVLN